MTLFCETEFHAGEVSHHIERVTNNETIAFGLLLDYLAHAADDTRVGLHKIVTAHAGFAGDATGDDDQVAAAQAAGSFAPVILASNPSSRPTPSCRAPLLRHAFDDVHHHHVGDLFLGDTCRSSPDEPGAKTVTLRFIFVLNCSDCVACCNAFLLRKSTRCRAGTGGPDRR